MRSRSYQRLGAAVLILGALYVFSYMQSADRGFHKVFGFSTGRDVVPAETRHGLCRQHGWKVWGGDKRRKTYDLFMANTELDWLEIRLNTSYPFVDYFVIVESPKTFTNLDKPLTIKENLHSFEAYRDKIIYHELDIPKGFHSDRSNPAWDFEDLQRNAMYKQVFPRLKGAQAPQKGDVIIVADVDEILRPETLVVLKTCDFPRRLNLRSNFYYYSFQWLHNGTQWSHPQATYYQGWRTILPTNLRNGDGNLPLFVRWETANLWNAGWHCSSCFSTVGEMLTKMSSFSHQSMNEERFRDKDRMAKLVRQGKDLWDREGEVYLRVDKNIDVPQLLLEQPKRFEYLLNRDGPNAGFTDYP
jgi:beta-1,4-mannosyl-glycoprotein beta-1,4-N-acetylglucosaminyltransferase